MPDISESQLLVIGGGPVGYAGAFLAADKGMKVTLIDAAEKPGGTCLHVGCIPSKALLHAAKLITDARDAAHVGLKFAPPEIDLTAVRGREFKVIDTLSSSLVGLSKKRGVQYVCGRGRFVDGQTIQVEGGSQYRFQHCI